ncbi:hypothetical protein ACFYPF_11330 [Micromonospora sp. NPDC005223]|uniref:hypothetical protein n=1 Tax=Micromonospora sp. NPDC005223 TaxID=3364227 RepID=UPI0036CEE89F
MPERHRLVALTPSADVDDPFGLLTLTPPAIGSRTYGTADLWPAVLPGHRGVVAAHVLPELAMAAQEDLGGEGPVLLTLAECTGAGGPALDLAMAYGLCARHEADRVAALDALLLLAAAGDLDAPAVGGHLGEIGAQGQVILTRAVTPLRDALAAEAATATGVRIEVPGLADVAARGGGPGRRQPAGRRGPPAHRRPGRLNRCLVNPGGQRAGTRTRAGPAVRRGAPGGG